MHSFEEDDSSLDAIVNVTFISFFSLPFHLVTSIVIRGKDTNAWSWGLLEDIHLVALPTEVFVLFIYMFIVCYILALTAQTSLLAALVLTWLRYFGKQLQR